MRCGRLHPFANAEPSGDLISTGHTFHRTAIPVQHPVVEYPRGSNRRIYCLEYIQDAAPFFTWLIFFIASLAECNRAPFDLPEAESELVAGFHTEYSGFRFAVIMLGEYAMMLLVSILGAVLFFGSWNSPLPDIGPAKLATWTTGQPGTIASSVWGIF